MAKLLIDKGALIDQRFKIRSIDHISPLLLAAALGNKEMVTLLLARGADQQVKSSEGVTLLMAAAQGGMTELVQHLIDDGGDVNTSSVDGLTALIVAARFPDLVKVLLQHGADVNAATKTGDTALLQACRLLKYDKKLQTPIIRMLLEHGADVNVEVYGLRPLAMVVDQGDLALVRLMLEHGANVNARNSKGKTALAIAVSEKHDDIADILKTYGGTL